MIMLGSSGYQAHMSQADGGGEERGFFFLSFFSSSFFLFND